MRPWLESMIESNSVSGLRWVDKEKTTFSIPWKHAARHGWEMDKDACLFQKWAIHTGKYVKGQKCNPKTWKANFRCALNSLPDIEEVKDQSVHKGQQAMRVFRMLPVSQKSKDRRRKSSKSKSKRKVKTEEEDPDYEESTESQSEEPHPDTTSTQENTVDSTVPTEERDFTYTSPSDVPEWSLMVEVGTEANGYRFEVSPEHSPDSSDNDYNDNITIKIWQPMEKDTHWTSSSLDGKGFLCNEACTSPGSQWSEASSADEVDERPLYTTLGLDFPSTTNDFPSTTNDLWSSFSLPPTLFDN